MKKKDGKKSKHAIGPFSFCPKHNVFYNSCGCAVPGTKRKQEEDEEREGDGTFVDEK